MCVCVYRKEGRLVLSFGDELEEEEGGRRRMDAGLHDMAAVKQLQVS